MTSGVTNESDWPRQDVGVRTTRLSLCVQTLPLRRWSGNETTAYRGALRDDPLKKLLPHISASHTEPPSTTVGYALTGQSAEP